MKKIGTLLVLLALTQMSFAQKIRLKVNETKDTTVFLVKYTGAKLYYVDTVEMKKGVAEFNGAKHTPGMFALLLPGQKYFDFLYNKEEISIETTGPDFANNMKILKSEENKKFNEYLKHLSESMKIQVDLTTKSEKLAKDSPEYIAIQKELEKLNKTTNEYQLKFVKENKGLLISQIIDLSIDNEIPEPPASLTTDEAKNQYRYLYYRDHFFDKVDFKNDAIVHSPIFGNKIETFFSNKMLIQHWDTITYQAFKLIDKMDPKSKAWEYTVQYVTSTFGKSQIMGMDKVYTLMAEKYYCTPGPDGKSLAHWMTKEKLDDLCEKIAIQKNLVIGVTAPNLILPDTLDVAWDKLNYINLHKVKAEYTILYFWDPECGHCKKISPKLAQLYNEKLASRNVKVYSVGKGNGGEYTKWKEAIHKYKMDNFYNVAVTETLLQKAKAQVYDLIPKYTNGESLNFHITYDIYSTPQVILLDKDKKIIAKRISISQLEDFLDRLQDKTDAPKLFPHEDEEDQHMK